MGTYDVKTAASVPTGMLFSGRWRSELMLKPAITPINTHTHTPNMYRSDCKYKHYVDFIYTAAEMGGGGGHL